MLSPRRYLNLPSAVLLQSLQGNRTGTGQRIRFDIEAIRPNGTRLTWLAKQWRRHHWDGVGLLPGLLHSELFATASQVAASV